nr:MAG TPA: hypothetical protein [Caudoviricetes sp.]
MYVSLGLLKGTNSYFSMFSSFPIYAISWSYSLFIFLIIPSNILSIFSPIFPLYFLYLHRKRIYSHLFHIIDTISLYL